MTGKAKGKLILKLDLKLRTLSNLPLLCASGLCKANSLTSPFSSWPEIDQCRRAIKIRGRRLTNAATSMVEWWISVNKRQTSRIEDNKRPNSICQICVWPKACRQGALPNGGQACVKTKFMQQTNQVKCR